jgi:hypothetical protein
MSSPFYGSMAPSRTPVRQRVARLTVKALGVWSAVLLSFVFTANLIGSKDPANRAVILMAMGLILLWVVLGGLLTVRYKAAIRRAVLRVPLDWRWRFVLMATGLAMIEEAITTSMTNLATVFGSTTGQAHITASTNYLIVIAFSSVVVFIPMFVGWMLLLRKWAFSPIEVFLLYGLLGTTSEASLNPTALISGFWFFVYGLMIYLPAYCLPPDRGATRPRWYHYPLTYIVPLACAMPVVVVDVLLARWLGIVLWR